MDEILRELIKKLPESPTELNKSTVKKIYRYIPVPTDYKIIWADIVSFGGCPAGVVITDRAIIVKASREEIKNNKNKIVEENKKQKTKEKIKAPKIKYQIIPWELYSPEDYEIVEVKDNEECVHYAFKVGETELAQFSNKNLYKMFVDYKEITEAKKEAEVFSAINTVNVESVMFNAAYGSNQTKAGHGIYAEEAGAILDKFAGEQSTVVGRDNAKNGPDKIVNASSIQCKYCKQAYNSVDACFKKNPQTGMKVFRYYDLNGNAMKIEVPADQYIQAVEYMKARIIDGQVPGITDPNAAYDIIRKGKLTYNQALNLAKAGTVESIVFDACTGAVNCLSVFGISVMVSFAQVYWVTRDFKKAAKSAIFTGLQVYGMSFAGGILASQISRTGLTLASTEISKAISPQMVEKIMNAFRTLAGKKTLHGVAAQKSFYKFLGSTAITQIVMFIVFSVPDTLKVANRKISGAQYCKNMTSIVASFAGSISTTTITGMVIGNTTGEKIDKKVGSAIGMVAGAVGGFVFGAAAKGIGNLIHEDDTVVIARLFNGILISQFMDYMLTSEEQDAIIELLNKDEKQIHQLQQGLRRSETQEADIIKYLEPKIRSVIKKRKRIGIDDEHEMEENIKSIVLEGDLEYAL